MLLPSTLSLQDVAEYAALLQQVTEAMERGFRAHK
jgi:hypothetical protein